MRISTGMVYDLGVAGIQRQQAAVLDIQQQLSANRRVLTPADDPIAAAQALQITEADEINTQFGVNRDYAGAQLQLTESALGQVTELVQGIRAQAVAAGNGSFTDAERASLAGDIDGMLEQLVGIANATDADGHYLFSGFQGKTLPFVRTPAGVQFVADEGQRLLQVGPSRQMASNASGDAVFQRIRNGNGSFTWSAAAGNTGSGVIGPGSVADPALLTGHDYRINFVTATTYDVVDATTAATVLAGQTYAAGAASIAFDGLSVNLQGGPAAGDSFAVAPSTDQSLFATIQRLAATLQIGGTGTASNTRRANGLAIALTDLDQALENVLAQRVSIGSHLRELDALTAAGEALGIQYQDTRSGLVDVDYAKAASDLTREQAALEASQKSFIRIAGLSLFDYL